MFKLLAIAWKDTLLRFSSRTELLFFLILPIVFIFMLGGGVGQGAGQGDTRLPILLVDPAPGPLSAEIRSALDASQTVRYTTATLAEAEQALTDNEAVAVLIVPTGLSMETREGALELRLAANNPNRLAVEQAVQAAVTRVGQPLGVAQAVTAEAERWRAFDDADERAGFFEAVADQARQALAEAPKRVVTTRASTSDSVDYDPATNQTAGQLITWVFIPLIGISALFAFERDQGTLRRLLITPTRRLTFLAGTLVGQVATALVQMLLLAAFGTWVMGVDWFRDPLALGVMLLAAALAAGALGVMLGTFVTSDRQANGLSIMLGMVMALLGGCWYPIELFPEAVRTVSQTLPTYWAMQGLLDIVLRGRGLLDILPAAGVLLGFTAAFLTVGVYRFRYA